MQSPLKLRQKEAQSSTPEVKAPALVQQQLSLRPLEIETSRNRASYRLIEIDAFRGLAITLMIPFHLLVDLNHFGQKWIGGPLPLPWWFWRSSSTLIGSMFLVAVGVSAWVGSQGLKPEQILKKQWKHFLRIAVPAALVTLVSLIFMPSSPIYFGILHCIAISTLLAASFLQRSALLNLSFGLFLGALGFALRFQPLPAGEWLVWLGRTSFVSMGDHYPLLPWLGLVLVGISFGKVLYPKNSIRSKLPAVLKPLKGISTLAFLGRHSLLIYVAHQPILLLILFALGIAERPLSSQMRPPPSSLNASALMSNPSGAGVLHQRMGMTPFQKFHTQKSRRRLTPALGSQILTEKKVNSSYPGSRRGKE